MSYQANATMDQQNYSDNLRHMAEPATPEGRATAVSVTLEDYQALYYASILREWSAYHADEEKRESIAKGYVEYIDKQVRDNDAKGVELYAHTEEAAETHMIALEEWNHAYEEMAHDDLYDTIDKTVGDLWGRHNADHVNADFPSANYDPAPDADDLEFEE